MIPEAHLVCPHGLGPNYCDRCAVLALTAQLAEAREMLREVEWVNFPNEDWISVDLCPVCGDGDAGTKTGRKETGHAPDCRLAKALEET